MSASRIPATIPGRVELIRVCSVRARSGMNRGGSSRQTQHWNLPEQAKESTMNACAVLSTWEPLGS
eukprot:469641-Pyramimonas_sp.AAC.1